MKKLAKKIESPEEFLTRKCDDIQRKTAIAKLRLKKIENAEEVYENWRAKYMEPKD